VVRQRAPGAGGWSRWFRRGGRAVPGDATAATIATDSATAVPTMSAMATARLEEMDVDSLASLGQIQLNDFNNLVCYVLVNVHQLINEC